MDYRKRRDATLDLWREAISECDGIVTARTVQEFAGKVADAERLEQAGLMSKAVAMLRRLEWSFELPATEDRDTFTACPICKQGSIFGLDAQHADGCEFAALLRELET